MQVKIKKVNPEAIIPSYALPGDAGMDLFSVEEHEIQPKERYAYKTGIALEIPQGFAGIVKDKSGLAKKHGLHVLGGVFDSGYRGEYSITLINSGTESYKIEKGQKVAQLLIYPVSQAELEEVEELSVTERGEGKWGSTGK